MIKKIYKKIQKKLFWSPDKRSLKSININKVEDWFDKTQSIVFTEEYATKEETFLLPYLLKNKFASVLDLGCGNGRYSKVLSSIITDYIGVDISNNFIQTLSEMNDRKNFSYYHSPAHKFKTTKKFDLILMVGLITYMNDDEIIEMNLNCHEHLNPEGIIMVRNVRHDSQSRRVFNDKWDILKMILGKPYYQIIRRPESDFLRLFSIFDCFEKHRISDTPGMLYFFKKK